VGSAEFELHLPPLRPHRHCARGPGLPSGLLQFAHSMRPLRLARKRFAPIFTPSATTAISSPSPCFGSAGSRGGTPSSRIVGWRASPLLFAHRRLSSSRTCREIVDAMVHLAAPGHLAWHQFHHDEHAGRDGSKATHDIRSVMTFANKRIPHCWWAPDVSGWTTIYGSAGPGKAINGLLAKVKIEFCAQHSSIPSFPHRRTAPARA